jgi:folate-dependent phosphoribosylglycinamide formyltransferase PurN
MFYIFAEELVTEVKGKICNFHKILPIFSGESAKVLNQALVKEIKVQQMIMHD